MTKIKMNVFFCIYLNCLKFINFNQKVDLKTKVNNENGSLAPITTGMRSWKHS